MSTIGAMYVLRVHQNPVTDLLVLDSMSISPFTNDSVVATTAVVKKEDFPATKFDSWVVKVAYPAASIPAGTTTLADLLAVALVAIQLVQPTAGDGVVTN